MIFKLACGPLLNLMLGLSSVNPQINEFADKLAQSLPLGSTFLNIDPKKPWNFHENPGVVPAAVVIIRDSQGRFLMARRSGSTGAGTFAAVGGKADQYFSDFGDPLPYGDNFFDAAIREADEEIRVQIKPEDLDQILAVTFVHPENGKKYVVVVFEAVNWSGRPEIREPHKMSDLNWYDLNTIRDQLYPATWSYFRHVEAYFKAKDEQKLIWQKIAETTRYN